MIPKNCPIVAILPKSHYLVKVLEIPNVSADQVAKILSLECEAALPSGFGSAESSYHPLPGRDDRRRRYEVYVSRRQLLKGYLNSLAELGIYPKLVLPSAVIWRRVLARSAEVDLLVASSNGNAQAEVASLGADGTISIRTFEASGNSGLFSINHGVIDCIRSILNHTRCDSSPVKIGWIGKACPSLTANGRAVLEDMTQRFLPSFQDTDDEKTTEPLACMAASSLLGTNDQEMLATANLLPREIVLRRSQRSVYKQLALGVVSVLLGIVLLYAALKIGSFRYDRLNVELSDRIMLIKTEGEMAGRRVTQLRAIHAALATNNRFYDVILGLYNATPKGVTYSHIELAESGQLQIRGQAESVSQPFLLPEKLGSQPMFDQVVLRSVGQERKGSGSVTRFRLKCSVRPMAAP